MPTVTNFGGNIRCEPRHLYTPRSEAEVLDILQRHARGQIRVMGSRHSWSPAILTTDALIELRHFNTVRIERIHEGTAIVRVGGGCRIRDLLRKLHAHSRYTLPSLGIITRQTIAGAISTGTHGSGKHSLAHYIAEVRLATYSPDTGQATIVTITGGDELRAARCSLGCLGVILSVTIRCIPRYDVAESIVACRTLAEVLAEETQAPLQQFYLLPYRWTYLVQRRRALPTLSPRRGFRAMLYRAWWFLGIDAGLHLVLKGLVTLAQPRCIRAFFRSLLPRLIIKNWHVVDRAERMLVMAHDLFRHVEIELFVPESKLPTAERLIRFIVSWFDGTQPEDDRECEGMLRENGLLDQLRSHRGRYTHHYPITFRRVLPDDTLMSMASGTLEPYYAISFISLAEPRHDFLAFAEYLTRSLVHLLAARVHWGKICPLTTNEIEALYPHLGAFRVICERFDPRRTFQNEFTARIVPPTHTPNWTPS